MFQGLLGRQCNPDDGRPVVVIASRVAASDFARRVSQHAYTESKISLNHQYETVRFIVSISVYNTESRMVVSEDLPGDDDDIIADFIEMVTVIVRTWNRLPFRCLRVIRTILLCCFSQ
jgi:hypothetical protein